MEKKHPNRKDEPLNYDLIIEAIKYRLNGNNNAGIRIAPDSNNPYVDDSETIINRNTMETKQTAVEWYTEMDAKITRDFLRGELNQTMYAVEKAIISQQALQMEKEQIMSSYIDGADDVTNLERKQTEQYYTETYGTKTNSR